MKPWKKRKYRATWASLSSPLNFDPHLSSVDTLLVDEVLNHTILGPVQYTEECRMLDALKGKVMTLTILKGDEQHTTKFKHLRRKDNQGQFSIRLYSRSQIKDIKNRITKVMWDRGF